MSDIGSTTPGGPTEHQDDPRWQLVTRILSSPLFQKSPRLSSFLAYICEQEMKGRRDEINEQQIGVRVFGRRAGYNSSEDGIVRSQARFLRQRLEEYFKTYGEKEELRIAIPKGSYAPVFEANQIPAATPIVRESTPVSKSVEELEARVAIATPPSQKSSGRRLILSTALLVLLGVGLGFLLGSKTSHSTPKADSFWRNLFSDSRLTIVVPADSTLILLENLTHQPIHLQQYLDHGFMAHLPLPSCLDPADSADLLGREYTSMADLNLVARLVSVPRGEHSHVEVRHARDLGINDVKESNVILIGGARANPWVELFADKMNFYIDYDWKTAKNYVANRSPKPGEAATLYENDSERRVYGLVAFLPSLDNEGSALLVEGTSKPGTESAADFVFNPAAFHGFAKRIQKPDGSIPHFELLLETRNVGGSAPQAEILSYRILP